VALDSRFRGNDGTKEEVVEMSQMRFALSHEGAGEEVVPIDPIRALA
jgi:hypothetical protein